MSWSKKAAIGALAGLCLSLIKLIDANFYLAQTSTVALAGYLMCLAYILMAAIGAIFLNETNPLKLLRQGLLIPSAFLAIVQSGNPGVATPGDTETAPTVTIPELGAASSNLFDDMASFFFPSALAQPDLSDSGRITDRSPKIIIIDTRDLEPGIVDGVKRIWGRKSSPSRTFMFVVGKSDDTLKAAEAAERIGNLPAMAGRKISLVRFAADSTIYLTVGGLMPEKETCQLQYDIKDKVYGSRFAESDSLSEKTAQALLNGQVVDVRGIMAKGDQ
jgi:hypothetical protein